MANGNYKHGKYSRVLPVRLQQSYEEATHNPQLLSVRHDLAACEAMIQEAFARFDSGESGAAWRALQAALAAFEAAERRGDDAVMVAHLATMRALIRRGTREQAIIEDICTLWDSRCKLTMTEQKTLTALHQMMTKEQLVYYMGAITDAIVRHVSAHADESTRVAILGAIVAEFEQIALLGDGQPA